TTVGSMNTTITFPRPTKALLSMNDRTHWRRKSSDVKTWRSAGYFAAYNADERLPVTMRVGTCIATYNARKFPSLVYVTLDVPDKRRRDPANFFPCVKAIVDGLVDAGWWPDDTPEWVTVVEPVLRVVKGPLMVTVELRPR
ncbi:MAG TPA: hypothetical protein VHQ23_05815, partial [Ilumatobacteraceae bacterium]|nr:hypothetical protein [Ilumatobacteraceae bacterium]